jgi:hypothetical protein
MDHNLRWGTPTRKFKCLKRWICRVRYQLIKGDPAVVTKLNAQDILSQCQLKEMDT